MNLIRDIGKGSLDQLEARLPDDFVDPYSFAARIEFCVHFVQRYEQERGVEHPDLVWPLTMMIDTLRAEGAIKPARAARAVAERRLAIQRSALGPDHPELLYCLEAALIANRFEGRALDAVRAGELCAEIAETALRLGRESDPVAKRTAVVASKLSDSALTKDN